MNLSKDLMAASSTALVLGILAEGENYGYEIVKRVADLSGGAIQWTDGMLYPLLHRMEQLGYLKARWHTADTGRRRKYYRLTPQGRKALTAQREQWALINDTLDGLWRQLGSTSGGMSRA